MKTKEFIFRQTILKDVGQILIMINRNAKAGKMLPKNKKQIFDLLLNYSVAVADDKVIGTCGCKIWVNESVEIISLTTLKRFQGQGIGTRLIQENIERGKSLGFKHFFAMTVVPDIFAKVGFKRVDYRKLSLKAKVWGDCAACPYNASDPGHKKCKEKAVELWLD